MDPEPRAWVPMVELKSAVPLSHQSKRTVVAAPLVDSATIPVGAYAPSYGCTAVTLPSNGTVGGTLFSNATAPVDIGGELSFVGLCPSVPFIPSFGLSNVTAGVSPFGVVAGLGLNVLTIEVASLNPISVTVSLTVTLAQTHQVSV